MIYTKWQDGFSSLEDTIKIRNIVFAEGLGFPVQTEKDGQDVASAHLKLFDSDGLCGVGRLCRKSDNEYIIGKIAVLEDKRNIGYGDLLVRMLIRKAFDSGADCVYAEVLKCSEEYFLKLEFISLGENGESGIIEMVRKSDVSGNCG